MIDWSKPLECNHGDISIGCRDHVKNSRRYKVLCKNVGISYWVVELTGEPMTDAIDHDKFKVRNKHKMWMATSSADHGINIEQYEYDERSLNREGWSYGGSAEFFKAFETKDLARIGLTEYLEKEIIQLNALLDDVEGL